MSTNLKGRRVRWIALLVGAVGLAVVGCESVPTDLANGAAPLRSPSPRPDAESYEDSLTGGEVFSMYCNQCHNARALGERPFSNYQNVAAHMRVRANLTGVEYAKLMEFLRRWHDLPSSTPPVEPSPKRLIYPQPIAELRQEPAPVAVPAAPAAGQPDARPPAGLPDAIPPR